ncbi:protein REPRESSOR OF SILENCING 3 [Telopea speciosissima]|uniref:protein REPRESSOR OF SILENCING 3 n=1 Tax=Telopea speciosissima TaxID=54955 RepID=UPI001CC78798|nr:protein REPRESSOR OF SILENCING 3 [Telopea speciosissima]
MKGEEEKHDKGNKTRVFVGGLGESVTAVDLQKTFSSLGTIESIEIVRTNGRSFAYMDFLPSSDKALSKLFSTYNGCMWKGGRLRIEKAKEHYFVRLQREWAEEVERTSHKSNNHLSADEKTEPSNMSKELMRKQNMQLQIFFPRLKKVKSLPYIGTGKHKYSFQRVEVPPLPVYFCDCEEHWNPRENAKQRQISTLEPPSGEISKEELHLMDSVMNKLLEKEDNANTNAKDADGGARLVIEGDHSSHPIDDVLVNGSETDNATDEDNIVMNIVTGGNVRSGLMRNHGTISANQESRSRKRQASDNRPAQNKLKAQKMIRTETSNASKPTSRKESHLYMAGESQREEVASAKHVKKESTETHCEKLEGVMEVHPTKSKPDVQPSRGLLWVQKSSWRELVGEAGNSSFSISEIVPVIPNNQGLPKSSGSNAMNSTGSKEEICMKHTRGQSTGESSQALEIGKDVPTDKGTAPNGSDAVDVGKTEQILSSSEGEKKITGNGSEIMEHDNNVIAEPVKKNYLVPKVISTGEAGIGEVCTFMRSAVSEREWMKTKTALSGSLKKKSNEK